MTSSASVSYTVIPPARSSETKICPTAKRYLNKGLRYSDRLTLTIVMWLRAARHRCWFNSSIPRMIEYPIARLKGKGMYAGDDNIKDSKTNYLRKGRKKSKRVKETIEFKNKVITYSASGRSWRDANVGLWKGKAHDRTWMTWTEWWKYRWRFQIPDRDSQKRKRDCFWFWMNDVLGMFADGGSRIEEDCQDTRTGISKRRSWTQWYQQDQNDLIKVEIDARRKPSLRIELRIP